MSKNPLQFQYVHEPDAEYIDGADVVLELTGL